MDQLSEESKLRYDLTFMNCNASPLLALVRIGYFYYLPKRWLSMFFL